MFKWTEIHFDIRIPTRFLSWIFIAYSTQAKTSHFLCGILTWFESYKTLTLLGRINCWAWEVVSKSVNVRPCLFMCVHAYDSLKSTPSCRYSGITTDSFRIKIIYFMLYLYGILIRSNIFINRFNKQVSDTCVRAPFQTYIIRCMWSHIHV